MEIKTFLTGYLTAKVLKPVVGIIILFLLVHQCNRGCGRDQVTDTGLFDYTAIATVIVMSADSVDLPEKDSIPLSIALVAEELEKIIPSEAVEFAKTHSGQFAMHLNNKYALVNGYVSEKIK